MNRSVRRMISILGLSALLVSCGGGESSTPTPSGPTAALTASALFEWDANQESDLSGYKIYKGTASGQYGAALATLPSTATGYEATGLQKGTTYFFVITAFDTSGNESALSNELTVMVP
ncbi:MAG TPA: fibronectin type III domain-containing protein [Nitrospira sp.]